MNFLSLVFLCLSHFSFAHVTMEPKTAAPGEYTKLTFRVPHGCDGSPTTKISVAIPAGVVSVKPQVHPGWKISTKTVKYAKPVNIHGKDVSEGVSEVEWAGGPLEDAYMDEFGMAVKLPENGTKLEFPVVQTCEKGVANWKDNNAPTVTLEGKAKHDEHHH